MSKNEVDPEMRAVLAENARLLRGERLYFSECAAPDSDRDHQENAAPSKTVDDDILSVLREEAEAVGGPLAPEQIAAFAQTF